MNIAILATELQLLPTLGEMARLSSEFVNVPIDAYSHFAKFTAQIADGGDGGGGNQDIRGAVGNMVTAYLQTKGLIDQAKILTDFRETLEMIAALFFLSSISLAVGAVAIFGNYRQALYFLIGPPLFFFMIQAKATTNGTEVRFGSYTVNNAAAEEGQMLRHIRAIDEDGETTVEISRFFGLWDAIVSEGVQAVVQLLIDTDNKDHLRFIARERMLNYVLNSSADTQGFIRLIGAIYYGECASMLPDIQRLRALNKDNAPVKVSDNQSELYSKARMEKFWAEPRVHLDLETKSFLLAMKNGDIPGFESIPLENVRDTFVPSCKEVWGYITSAGQHVAKKRVTTESFMGHFAGKADTSDIDWEQVQADLQALLSRYLNDGEKTDEEKSRDYVAALILKNTSERSSVQMLNSQTFGRTPFNSSYDDDIQGVLAKTEGHGGFMQLKYFADSIPYLQGFFLYVLSIAFPFFALFLVIPSRATSFFAWMGLWAWVKSWDVGFAAIHVFRDVYWKFLASRVNTYGTNLDLSDPASVVSLLYNNDPFYGENTYWMIISSLTLAIPFVTAHFFLGATGMFDLFSGTIDQTAAGFGSTERQRSRRFVGNVNEHLQRVQHARHSIAKAQASLSHDSLTPEQQAQAAEDGSLIGATHAGGRPVIDAPWGGISSDQSLQAAREGVMASISGMISTGNFQHSLNQIRGDAIKNNHDSALRGLMPDQRRVAPEIRDNNGKLVGYDMSALEYLVGKGEQADKMAAEGVTWGELDRASSEYQLHNQALTGSITGRRMLGDIRSARNGAPKLNAISAQQRDMARGSAAAAKISTTPGLGDALSLEIPYAVPIFNYLTNSNTHSGAILPDASDKRKPGIDGETPPLGPPVKKEK